MMLSERIETCASGDQLWLLASDPATLRDVPKYCAAMGHSLLEVEEGAEVYRFLIQVR